MRERNKPVVVLVKDRELAVTIKKCIREKDENIDILLTDNADMAYKVICRKTVSLFVADLEAGVQENGNNTVTQIIRRLRKEDRFLFLPVIVLSQTEEYRTQALCEWNCAGYYKYPFCPEDFANKAGHILQAELPDEQDNVFVIRRHNVRYPVKVRELMYVRYFDRALHLYMSTGDVFVVDQRPVQMILDLARAGSVMQCSRGALVNLAYVNDMDFGEKQIGLCNGERLRIGETYEKELKEAWVEIDEVIVQNEVACPI